MTRGISNGELIAYCGRPSSQRDAPVDTIQRGNGVEHHAESAQQEWIYDLGGNFLYALSLTNGRVDNVRSVPR